MYETLKGETDKKWIDRNDHVNISAYTILLDKSLDILCNLPGSIYSIMPPEVTFVASRIFIAHVSELLYPSPWTIEAGITSLNLNGFISYHCLFSNGKRVARFYLKSSFFNLNSRKSVHLTNSDLKRYSFGLLEGIKDPFINYDS